jgi:predicted methyltransferase MtxX (methanogen marker protein 4)
LPSLLAGNLTRSFGLVATTDGYGAVLIILSLGALIGLLRERPVKVCGVDVR